MTSPDPLTAALKDVMLLESELRRRRPDIEKRTRYYNGDHPLVFASDQFREWFGTNYKGFADNWCVPVVDAMAERMSVAGVRPREATKTDEELGRFWEQSGAEGESQLAWTSMATTGRVFGLVWGDENDEPEVTFEHASQAIVAYEPGSRRKRRAALKLWCDSWTGDDYATLYLPGSVWKFERPGSPSYGSGRPTDRPVELFGGWRLRVNSGPNPMHNPMGVVPMVELQNRPRLLGDPLSEIAGIIPMQDAVNTLWSYLFTAGDFAALPQRVILGAQLPKIPILNEQGQKIGEKPIDLPEANIKRILNLDGPNAKIDQWDSAKLDVFTGVIERAVNHIGNQTRTPLYMFASSIQNISGDTLKALDNGLVAKVYERKRVNNDSVREIFRMMALVLGDEAKAESVASGRVMWTNHEVQSDAQKVDALSKLKDIGFPFAYIAEQYVNGDADELARLMEMYTDQLTSDPLMALMKQTQGAGPNDQPAGSGNADSGSAPSAQQANNGGGGASSTPGVA